MTEKLLRGIERLWTKSRFLLDIEELVSALSGTGMSLKFEPMAFTAWLLIVNLAGALKVVRWGLLIPAVPTRAVERGMRRRDGFGAEFCRTWTGELDGTGARVIESWIFCDGDDAMNVCGG